MTTDTTIRGKYSTYHVIRPLKSGGMGEVLLASDERDRRVAIKRPFASAPADELARFQLEGEFSTLEHSNIAKIYEAGIQADGSPYLAMEYVDGKELKDIIEGKEQLEDGKPLDLLDKLSIIEQVCAGLGYAHQKGLIHRDIKPGNVMVYGNQHNRIAKIIDFGIAKKLNLHRTTDLTQPLQIIGSLHYIAPERFKNEAADGRVDVFSAGVMLYLLLTGTLPFSGGEHTASHQIMHEAPAPLGAHFRDYPPALDAIMERALAKNPDNRFATAEDFADALHEVIEHLTETRVAQLFDDAERLTVETRYEPALDLLNEAITLAPSHTQARKLRRMVLEHQKRRYRSEQLKEYVARADQLLAVENYAEALVQLKDAQRVDTSSHELQAKIASVEETKRRHDKSAAALAEAETAQNRGDIVGALRISEAAVSEDPNNTRLLALRAAISKQLEREAQQAQMASIFNAARTELSAKNFPQVERLLLDAEAIDRSHPKIEEMRREMAGIRQREEHREALEEIHRRVNKFLQADNYEQASDLLTRALEKLPSDTMLHRMKMEVDTAAQKFDSIRFVNRALASAQEAFASDPQKSLSILRQALQHQPGDERLIASERSFRQQSDELRVRQLLDESLRTAREFLAADKFDKAIDVLETYQLEHGKQADVDDLLNFARVELASQQRRLLVDRASAEARSLIGNKRLDDAARLLESALQSTAIREYGDRSLSGLLEDVRAQQSAAERKREAVVQRAAALRERGELDAAIQILGDYLATGARNASAEDLLSSIRMERTRKQVTKQAIEAAEQATAKANFSAALESLQAVVQAYGESEELTRAAELVKQARTAHAQKVVGQSIETSRAALVARDVTGAMAALRAANEMVEFADAARQADWRRIGQAAKKAQSEPTGTIIADPLAELPEAATGIKRTSPLVLGLGGLAACMVLGLVGFLVLHKSPPPSRVPIPTVAQILISKAPSGALVSIDGGTPQLINADGITVIPGVEHQIEVTAEGFEPFRDKLTVAAGTTSTDNILMTKVPLVNNAGILVMQGNVPAFKVTVDGQSRGVFSKRQNSLKLEVREHTIVYSNEDGSGAISHTILIAAGKPFTDRFNLKLPIVQPPPPPPPPPGAKLGSLVVDTDPNALITVDGMARGKADSSGKLPVPDLIAGNHRVDISLDNYQSVSGLPVTIFSGQPTSIRQRLTASAPIPGSLSVHTTAGAQVSLNNGQRSGTADGSGNLLLNDLKPGTYALDITKDNFQPIHVDDVEIKSSVKTPVPAPLTAKAVTPFPPPPPPPPPPVEDQTADIQGIKTAVSNFKTAFESKNLGKILAAWPSGGAQAKKLADNLAESEFVKMNVDCKGVPEISGDTAKQYCNETALYVDKGGTATHSPFIYTFAKTGSKWVLKDRKSLK